MPPSKPRARKARAQPELEASASPDQLEQERKRLMAALAELAALLRRPEPPRKSSLALGRIMQRNGLERRHVSALLTIALHGPMTITQLAQRHHVTLKTASLIAVELQEAGLVERHEDPTDRRRTIVTIAKSKEAIVTKGLKQRTAHLDRTLAKLTPGQREGLITGLEVLADEMRRSFD